MYLQSDENIYLDILFFTSRACSGKVMTHNPAKIRFPKSQKPERKSAKPLSPCCRWNQLVMRLFFSKVRVLRAYILVKHVRFTPVSRAFFTLPFRCILPPIPIFVFDARIEMRSTLW